MQCTTIRRFSPLEEPHFIAGEIQSIATHTCDRLYRIHELIKSSARTVELKRINLTEKAIRNLDSLEESLDKGLPNLFVQRKIDALGLAIEKLFAPLGKFNEWLESNGHGAWYQQLAEFLLKLPLRSATEILNLLYQFVKASMYCVVHPCKSEIHLAKLAVRLLSELLTPETWAATGARVVGNLCGFALVTANPFPLLGIGIGGALVLGGISLSAFKAALLADDVQSGVKNKLLQQAKTLPQKALTGFFMGLCIGGIKRAIASLKTPNLNTPNQKTPKEPEWVIRFREKMREDIAKAEAFAGPISTMEDLQAFISKIMEKYHLPYPKHIWFNQGCSSIEFRACELPMDIFRLMHDYPGFFRFKMISGPFPFGIHYEYLPSRIHILLDESGLVNSETY